jgi:hypothetical protein
VAEEAQGDEVMLHSFIPCWNDRHSHVHERDVLQCLRKRVEELEFAVDDKMCDALNAVREDGRRKWEAQVAAANRGLQKVSRKLILATAALGNIKANGRQFETDVVNSCLRELERIDKGEGK